MINIRYPLLLALAFAYLFYHFELGVNVVVFDGLLLLTVLAGRPELVRHDGFRYSMVCLLIAALSVVIVHSTASVLAHHVSLLLLIGFAQRRELRFVFYGLLIGILALASGPWRWLIALAGKLDRYRGGIPVKRWVRPALTATLVSLPFFVLYSTGSGDFLFAVERLVESFGDILTSRTLSTGVLFLFGLNLSLALYLTCDPGGLSSRQESYSYRLIRKRVRVYSRRSPLALPRAYRSGLLTLTVLNALLLLVNATDLVNVWVGYRPLTAPRLSEFVHAGTVTLLLSIGLAMVVVLLIFRANLNFYRGGRPLRLAAYAWLAQNAFLAVSVLIRNGYYVRAYGLAEGRIHVGILIAVVLIGLYTLYRKVRYRQSIYYLLQVNGMAVWLFLVAYGAVNWGGVITRYNVTWPTDRIDWKHLVEDLDRSNTFLLRREADRIPPQLRNLVSRRDPAVPHDWRGWNYAAWRNAR